MIACPSLPISIADQVELDRTINVINPKEELYVNEH
jgi:hypothetical protein